MTILEYVKEKIDNQFKMEQAMHQTMYQSPTWEEVKIAREKTLEDIANKIADGKKNG